MLIAQESEAVKSGADPGGKVRALEPAAGGDGGGLDGAGFALGGPPGPAENKPRRRGMDGPTPGRRVETGGRQCQWNARPLFCDRIDTGRNHARSLQADFSYPPIRPRVQPPLGGMLFSSCFHNACVCGGLGRIDAPIRAGIKTFTFSDFYASGGLP